MKTSTYTRIFDFRDKLNITDDHLVALNEYRDCFVSKKDEFAQRFYRFFLKYQEAKPLLEHVTIPGNLYKTWASWFESLFRDSIDNEYLEYLWGIGRRHTERNVDQRFTILGFSIIRQYIHEIVRTSVPADKISEITETMNKLLDLCLFVMTTSYIETTTQCDIEVIRGIADKIRNPVTVIGGNIHRLKRKVDQKSHPEVIVYDSVLEENEKIAKIIENAKTYLELFSEEPQFERIAIAEILHTTLEKLLFEISVENLRINMEIDPSFPYVEGDLKHIEHIFYAVLKNSLEAINRTNPQIKIKTALEQETNRNLKIEIFNTGLPPKEENMEKLFAPFFSTKTTGTGFGLATARLALKKNYGKINIKPVPQQGTVVTISLPLPD